MNADEEYAAELDSPAHAPIVVDSPAVEVEPDEVSETYTIIEVPVQLHGADLDKLPRSPKSAFKAAIECGWEVRVWVTVGQFAPTYYVASSDTHAAGEQRAAGYRARVYIIEGRDPQLPLGFQAHYVAKEYADGRKASAGGFDHARIIDPVGIPVVLSAVYAPIRQLRDKYENSASFQKRVTVAKQRAEEMTAAYNDGAVVYPGADQLLKNSASFNTWLAEWQSFAFSKPPRSKSPKEAPLV